MQPATQPTEENRRARKTAAAKQRYRNRIPKVGTREIPLFRKNPRREEQFGIKSYVVCRECRAKRKKLNGNAWAHLSIHGLTEEQYCGPSGKWPGAPLVCEELRRELSQRAKLQMIPTRGRPRQLKSVRGHVGEQAAPKWPIVRALANGEGFKAAGKEVKRSPMTVWTAAQKIGFCGERQTVTTNAFYDFGEPVTTETIQALRKSAALSAPQFAKQTGIELSVVRGVIRPRRKGQRIQPGIAKRVIAWRDDLLRQLLATTASPTRGEDRYSGSRILKTFFPDLKSKRGLLLRVMRWCRRSEPVTISMNANDLGELFCAQAMLEVANGPRETLFARFLPWAPDLIRFFQANLQLIKGRGNLWPVADAAIAQRWNTTRHVVSGAWDSHWRAIPADEMRRLIEGLSPAQKASAPEGPRPGPVPLLATKRTDFAVGKEVETLLSKFRLICADVQALPRRARTNLERASNLLKEKKFSTQELQAALRSPGDPLIAARWFIAITTKRQYNVVAKYHQTYRRVVANPDPN